MQIRENAGWGIYGTVLLSFIFFSNFSILTFGFHDEKRIVEAFFLLFGSILFLIFYFKYRITGFGSKTRFFFTVILGLLTTSSLLALLRKWAFLQVGWYVLLLQLIILCVYLYQHDRERYIRLLISALFLLAGIYMIQVLSQILTSFLQEGWPIWPDTAKYSMMLSGEELIPQGFLNFSNFRSFNHLQTWSLPLLVFGALYYKERLIPGLRYLMYAIAAGWWMLVFAAEARGTLIGSIISLALIAFLYRKRTKEYLRIYGWVVLAGFGLYLILFFLPELNEPGRGILSRYADHSGRLAVWAYTLKQIAIHPLLGLGPMHFSYIGISPPASTPHDFILQSTVEWGIPAIIIFMGLILLAYVTFLRQKIDVDDEKQFLIRMALVASLSAGMAHSFVSGIFNTPFSQLLFCMIAGWAVGHYYEHKGTPLFLKRRKRSGYVWLVSLLLVANTIFVAQKVARDVPRLNERNEAYFKKARKEQPEGRIPFYPRFWQQGKIGIKR